MARTGDVLNAAEAGNLHQVFSDPRAKEAVMSMNQMKSLSDKMSVVELPFELRA